MKLTFEEFCKDPQGRTYADVIQRGAPALKEVLEVLSDPKSQQRMEDSQEHHDRPALAGVVKAIESRPQVQKVQNGDPDFAKRVRQATGVAVKMVMERLGWKTTGVKVSVAVGLFFNKAEYYERP
jgi:hypothetical protein